MLDVIIYIYYFINIGNNKLFLYKIINICFVNIIQQKQCIPFRFMYFSPEDEVS